MQSLVPYSQQSIGHSDINKETVNFSSTVDYMYLPIPRSDDRFARQDRYGPPPEFPLASPCPGIDLIGPTSSREAGGWGRGMGGTNYWVLGRERGRILHHKEYSQCFVITVNGG